MPVPYIETTADNTGVCSSAAFALAAIDLERCDRPSRLLEAHLSTVRLLQSLAYSAVPLTLELHILSRPSRDSSRSSVVELGLLLRIRGSCREIAIEHCLGQWLSLDSLLHAFWAHADFTPVERPSQLARMFKPFQPGSCVEITHRTETICLSQPHVLTPQSIGFGERAKSVSAPGNEVHHVFPWSYVPDDWATLLTSIVRCSVPLWIRVRLRNSVDASPTIRELDAIMRECERFLTATPADQVVLTARVQSIREVSFRRAARLSECALRASVFLFAPGRADEEITQLLGQSISGDVTRGAASSAYEGCFAARPCSFKEAEESAGDVVPCDEAALAFRLPVIFPDTRVGLPVRRHQTVAADLPSISGTVIGINRHRGTDRPIEVSLDHRLKHTFLIGMTGTGKSTMMLSMLLDDLRHGRGICLIDPHGDLADDVLAHFPEERSSDLILIDMADRDRPVPMNLLAWSSLEQRDVIIDGFLSALLRIYRDPSMFGPVFERHFRNMLKLLMGDEPNREPRLTLLEFPRLYQSQGLRNYLVSSMKDEQVKDFIREFDHISYGDLKPENMAPYITAKLSRFIDDSLLRRTFGHGAMILDFDRILDAGQVLILKLGSGRFGANVADLVTSQVITRFRMAAMARGALPKVVRRPYFLYVDELGSLARDETFSQLLSEARKYGLGLVLATQYASQLRHGEYSRNTLSAVVGNVGTVIVYRVGVEDAPLLAPVFAPDITPQDLIECPNFEGYMRLHLDKTAVRPFSFVNRLEGTPASEERAKNLCEQSRSRWGVPAQECDRRAEERRQMLEAFGSG